MENRRERSQQQNQMFFFRGWGVTSCSKKHSTITPRSFQSISIHVEKGKKQKIKATQDVDYRSASQFRKKKKKKTKPAFRESRSKATTANGWKINTELLLLPVEEEVEDWRGGTGHVHIRLSPCTTPRAPPFLFFVVWKPPLLGDIIDLCVALTGADDKRKKCVVAPTCIGRSSSVFELTFRL